MSIVEVVKKFLYEDFILIDDANETVKKVVNSRNRLSFYELEDIVLRNMKKAVLNDTVQVKTSDIYTDIAIAQRIKIRFKTNIDDPEIFESSIT